MQKHVNLVDLVKSFPTNIFLQNLAAIQKRTSPIKFAHLAEKSGKGSISNLSTKKICAWRLPFFISLRGAAKEIADGTQDPRLLDYRRNVHGVEIRMKVSGIGFDTAENGPSKFSTPQPNRKQACSCKSYKLPPASSLQAMVRRPLFRTSRPWRLASHTANTKRRIQPIDKHTFSGEGRRTPYRSDALVLGVFLFWKIQVKSLATILSLPTRRAA